MSKVLFVCLGNICRSPTAQGIFQRRVDESPLRDRIVIDSAGTGDWHIGRPPDSRMQEAASNRGYDLSPLRARQVSPEDFHRFDLILAMDRSNLADLQAIRPQQANAELRLFLDYATGATIKEVPDPYYGGEDGFYQVIDLVEDAADGLLRALARELGEAP